jgi:serine/threonine protein kinase
VKFRDVLSSKNSLYIIT